MVAMVPSARLAALGWSWAAWPIARCMYTSAAIGPEISPIASTMSMKSYPFSTCGGGGCLDGGNVLLRCVCYRIQGAATSGSVVPWRCLFPPVVSAAHPHGERYREQAASVEHKILLAPKRKTGDGRYIANAGKQASPDQPAREQVTTHAQITAQDEPAADGT